MFANGSSLVYDVSNRMTSSSGTLQGLYEYDPSNKRVYQAKQHYDGNNWVTDSAEYYFYGITGQKLGTFTATVSGSSVSWSAGATQVFFGRKLIKNSAGNAQEDARASVGSYYPYGEDRNSTPNDAIKFATYTRDSVSGLDYADQRFYGGFGRFLSPDPYEASGGPGDPVSWNRYAYGQGDPINNLDPSGQSILPVDVWNGEMWLTVYFFFQDGPSRRPKKKPVTSFPECNPQGNDFVEKKLDFIYDNSDAAVDVAKSIQKDLSVNIDINALATAFLEWSAWESGYGQDKANVAENNFFGAQNPSNIAGAWNGSAIPCVRDGKPISVSSKNACFAPSLTWGQELVVLLSSTSGKTNVSYLSALEAGLRANPNESEASIIQSIGNNGWNGGAAYGATIANGMKLVNCLRNNEYIP